MNISIKQLEHFRVVAQELHFRRAAELAQVTQPALSRSIQTLENELGVQLLERNNRNVKLTAAGTEFLAGSADVMELMNRTIEKSVRARQSETGVVSVGYTYTAMCSKLPQLLTEFEASHPHIKLHLTCLSSSDQLERLHHDELDVCFLLGPTGEQGVNTSLFQTHRYAVIINKNHHLATKEFISVRELSDETILLRSTDKASVINRHIITMLENAGVRPNIEYHDQNHLGLLGSAVLNKGVCIATEGYGCMFSDSLKTIPLVGTLDVISTIMTWRKNKDSETVKRFCDFALSRINNTRKQPSTHEKLKTTPEPV